MEGRRIFPTLSVGENLRLGAAVRNDPAGVEEDLERWTTFFPILGERFNQAGGKLSQLGMSANSWGYCSTGDLLGEAQPLLLPP